jgi:hypothetical protein
VATVRDIARRNRQKQMPVRRRRFCDKISAQGLDVTNFDAMAKLIESIVGQPWTSGRVQCTEGRSSWIGCG